MSTVSMRRFTAGVATAAMLLSSGVAFANDAPTACPEGQTAKSGFKDTAGTTHEQNIDCIGSFGITTGVTATSYAPGQDVTRAQMATFMARTIALGVTLPTASDQGFQDIAGTAHEERINQLAELNVVQGLSASAYGPSVAISRGQMAVFLVRSWQAITGEALVRQGTRRFDDTEGTAFADAIDVAFEMGWALGDGAGKYGPAAPVSRGAMASFIARFIEDLQVKGAISGGAAAPAMTAFTVTDGDGSGTASKGDVFTLAYDKTVVANSSITVQDDGGDRTIIDDKTALATVDGRTPATLTGSNSSTLTFTLLEDPDVTCPTLAATCDGLINGTLTIVASQGITGVDGQSWTPANDPAVDRQVTLTPKPAGGGGGGGGGGVPTDTTAPDAPTVVFAEASVTDFNAWDTPFTVTAEALSTVELTIVDRLGNEVTGMDVAADANPFVTNVDLRTLVDGAITVTATATDTAPVPNTSLDSAPDAVVKSTTTPTIIIDDTQDGVGFINKVESSALRIHGTALTGATVDLSLVNALGDEITATATATGGNEQFTFNPSGTYEFVLNLAGTNGRAVVAPAEFRDGPVTATATVSCQCQGGFAFFLPVSDTSTLDTVVAAPSQFTFSPDPVNLAGQQNVLIGMSTEPGATVVITNITDGDAGTDDLPASGTIAVPETGTPGTFQTSVDLQSLEDGVVTVTASATDLAGNVSDPGIGSVDKDSLPPANPTVNWEDELINADEATDTRLTGTADAVEDSLVTITIVDRLGGTVVDTVTATAGVAWEFLADVSGLADGELTATATATDLAGNGANAPSAPAVSYLDQTAPGTPTIAFDDSEPISAAEAAAGVDLSGTASQDVRTIEITVVDDLGGSLVTQTAVADGLWSLTGLVVSSLDNGTITATAVTTDKAGNPSATSVPDTTILDQDVPAAPSPLVVNDNGDGYWNIAESEAGSLNVTGTAEPASTVRVTLTDGVSELVMTTTAGALDGSFSVDFSIVNQNFFCTISCGGLQDGLLTASATATDAAGNKSPGSAPDTTTLDRKAPAVEQITFSPDPVGQATSGAVTLTGTSSSTDLASVAIVISDINVGTADVVPADAVSLDGTNFTSESFSLGSQVDGEIVASVTPTDKAGNVGEVATGSTTLDRVAPPVPAIEFVTNPLNLAANDVLLITGTAAAEEGLTIEFTITGLGDSYSVPSSGGAWEVTVIGGGPAYGQGTITVTAWAIDAAGNRSSGAANATTLHDTIAPADPVIVFMTDPVNLASQGVITVTGTAASVDTDFVTVTLTDGVTSTAFAVDVVDGAWSHDFTDPGFAQGTITASAEAVDLAENPSVNVVTRTATKDTVAPTFDVTNVTQTAGSVFTFEASEDLADASVESGDFTFSDGLCGPSACVVDTVTETAGTITLTLRDLAVSGEITLKAGAVDDLAGNSNPEAKVVTVAIVT